MTPCTESGISLVMNGWETDRFNTSIKIIEKQAPSGRTVIRLV
jgi:hypothetical protein